jgi:hypothetical protein
MIGIIRNVANFEQRDLGQLKVLSGVFKTFLFPSMSRETSSDPSDHRVTRYLWLSSVMSPPLLFRANSPSWKSSVNLTVLIRMSFGKKFIWIKLSPHFPLKTTFVIDLNRSIWPSPVNQRKVSIEKMEYHIIEQQWNSLAMNPNWMWNLNFGLYAKRLAGHDFVSTVASASSGRITTCIVFGSNLAQMNFDT